jgi:AcrR family transcriptional regulator
MIDADQQNKEGCEVIAAPPRRERRDAAAHRQRILAVARHLFAVAGVAAVSMHQIAQAAGIGQGTLYRRYANKGDLCCDLLYEHHQAFANDLRAWLANATPLPALERLDEVLRRALHFVDDSADLLEAMMATDLHCTLSSASFEYHHWFRWLHDVIESLLAEAMEKGEIVPLDAPFTADMLLALMNPLMIRLHHGERGYSLERIIAGVRHIFIQGLHQTAPPAPSGNASA